MSSIDEIMQRIAVANAESKRINEERSINIGKKETLTKQLTTAIEKYKNDYGVDVSTETLDAEIARVTTAKEEEIKNIETVLSLIQEGRYVDAENVVMGNTTTASEHVNTVEPTTVVTPVEPVATPVEPVTSTIQPTVPASPVMPSVPASPSAPASPSTPASPVTPASPSPLAPPPVNTSGIAALNNFSAPMQESPVAPSVPVEPSMPSAPASPTGTVENVTSFSAILGGSSFQV